VARMEQARARSATGKLARHERVPLPAGNHRDRHGDHEFSLGRADRMRQRDANADERAVRMRQRRAGVSSSLLSMLVSATVAEQIV
jgi:hypothetical protein